MMKKIKMYIINQLSFPFICLMLVLFTKGYAWKKSTYQNFKIGSFQKLHKWQWTVLDCLVKNKLQ